MRTLLLLLLLLPSSLVAQVKILMPVLVKDAAGKPVTDLKLTDFQVTGPKNIRVQDMSLVQPQMVSNDDARPSVAVLYDAANMPSNGLESNTKNLTDFLSDVATHRLPVTVLVNTQAGLRLVYNVRTPPEILSTALAISSESKLKSTGTAAPITDAKVDQQVKNLQLLSTAVQVPRSRLDASADQMKTLMELSRLLQQLPGRKAVIWVATTSPVSATQDPRYWTPVIPGVSIFPGQPAPVSSPETTQPDKPLLPMYEAMVEELNAAHVSLYPVHYNLVHPLSVGYVWDSWKGVQQLAESTGGLAFQTSILLAVQSTLEGFGPYYMLTVEVPTPKELGWTSVKIGVNRPGVTVRAAPGFLGLKPVKTK